MAQTTPLLKPATHFGGTTYKIVTAVGGNGSNVAKFPTRPNTAYYAEFYVLAQAVDNYDEVNGYHFAALYKNDAGTLTRVAALTPFVAVESHAGWAVGTRASGTDIFVDFVTDDTTPVEVRVFPLIVELGQYVPHRFGAADNNPV